MSLVGAWLVLAFIAFATLSPLQDRPVVAGPQFEHFAAFALMGFAFVRGYPSRLLLIIAVVVCSAFALEALQLLTPDRHGRLIDALVKVGGGLAGIAVAHFVELLLRGPLNRFKGIRPDAAQEPPSALQP
ncbi:VanZ family protein [Bradyrhizobium cenepequi]|uniref:VanZ family protein n=1 Tax=Bradyrhizobium cenepequi TaxID=2821403 RepID=UPI001CE27CB9|nr:VanZ family protein [Bradyrhizobium cenepequi]MCA6110256.1 VanZ family protein [Bradyrhizobium cenepequi]